MKYELMIQKIDINLSATELTDYVFHCLPTDYEWGGGVIKQDGVSESFVDAINHIKLTDGKMKFYIEWDEENEI